MEISVIIPVYNKQEYLPACVASFEQQDFADFELVMVDDGSTDGSSALCDQLQQQSKLSINVVHQENQGVTAARRNGLAAARGRFIIFADADDAYMPGALGVLHKAISETDADEVIGSYQDQHGNLFDSGLRGWVEPSRMLNDLMGMKHHFCVLWGIIFKRELLDGCLGASRSIVEREDILMQIKCLMKHPRIFFISDVVYHYTIGLPNNRVEDLNMIKAYNAELRLTLEPEWKRWQGAFALHQAKIYEKFLDKKQFVDAHYFKSLIEPCKPTLPMMERIVVALPPRVAYWPVHLYKWWLRRKG